MVDRFISKVRVKRTRCGFANYTDKQHHGIIADLLARKCGIGIYNSKQTLQSTTQDNVRSDLKPMTWRYITDFLSQRLCRIYCSFYTYTLFAKDKFIVGDTCAQIFTGG